MCNYILWWAKEDWRTSDFHVSEIHACDALHWSTGTIYNLPTSMDNWREFQLIQRRCNYNQWNGCFFLPVVYTSYEGSDDCRKNADLKWITLFIPTWTTKESIFILSFFIINKPVILGNRCHCRYGACLHFYFKTWVIEHILCLFEPKDLCR